MTVRSTARERARGEIDRCLRVFGATSISYDEDVLAFRAGMRTIRMSLTVPKAASFTHTKSGVLRDPDQQRLVHEQAEACYWHGLASLIRAKMEAVQLGVSSFEREFLAHAVVPSTGQTVGDCIGPQTQIEA